MEGIRPSIVSTFETGKVSTNYRVRNHFL